LPGVAIEISDVKCTDLIYIWTLPAVHVQLFRTVYSIFEFMERGVGSKTCDV
jgi:hypothetical protein